jgi:hypothetical protein
MEKASPRRVSRQCFGNSIEPGSDNAFIGGAWPPRLPPWDSPSAWRAVTTAFDHHLSLSHFRRLSKVRRKAGAVLRLMARLDRPMDTLSQVTCPQCEDPCCRRATLWYDFVDLLVMASTCQPWPPGQPMAAGGAQCRYLGQAGCLLPRIQRPWICTWYLCPRQTAQLEATCPSQRVAITRMVAGVKQLRRALEDAFIDAAMGGWTHAGDGPLSSRNQV